MSVAPNTRVRTQMNRRQLIEDAATTIVDHPFRSAAWLLRRLVRNTAERVFVDLMLRVVDVNLRRLPPEIVTEVLAATARTARGRAELAGACHHMRRVLGNRLTAGHERALRAMERAAIPPETEAN